MNLKTAKRQVLMILDEYSANGTLTIDKDLELRMNDFFDLAQMEVSRVKPVVKRYEVPLEPDSTKNFVAYDMPKDFDRLLRVWADGELTYRGNWLGKSLVLPKTEQREILIEYAAYPTFIDEDTPETFEFELAEDAQRCLPYHVAGSQLFVDFVVDSGKIMQRYHELLSALSPAIEQNGIEVEVMENI